MGFRLLIGLVTAPLGVLFLSLPALAIADGALCTKDDPCHSRGIFTKRSAGPSKGDAVKLNPAEVPTERITGVETLLYKGAFDFALVKGLGRIGAAISPSNNDETFFGAPADEDLLGFEDRMISRTKYKSGKYAVATAVNLITNEGSGLRHFSLNLGVIGRYEVATTHIKPGVGVDAIMGPLYAAGSYYQDEVQINQFQGPGTLTLNTTVTTISGGLSLDSVLIDYSLLQVSGDSEAKATVVTIAGFVDRFILTVARREVISNKPAFDYSTQTLIPLTSKVEIFGGVQARVASFLVLGAFYNYYLLHEGSVGATVFF
jgi:hypothetical protein